MDKSSALGPILAIGGILGGLMLDGGNVGQIIQPTAFMIVGGGTLGAVLLNFPLEQVFLAAKSMKTVFFHRESSTRKLIEQIVGFANQGRKQGIVSLDKELDSIEEPFLRKAVMLAVDGVQPNDLRHTMEFELAILSEAADRVAQVYDAAGGFAPTIGIIGAILGLIQVMQHLGQINEVGRGIAVAFVATVYGVAFANLIFLPMGGKLRYRRRENDLRHELMLEGVVAMLEGVNPRMLETKLDGFMSESERAQAKSGGRAAVAAGQTAEPVES